MRGVEGISGDDKHDLSCLCVAFKPGRCLLKFRLRYPVLSRVITVLAHLYGKLLNNAEKCLLSPCWQLDFQSEIFTLAKAKVLSI